ncbi:MAG TPA: PQQ-binding-like beta-propeller repeat protein [bacterium]|nr:PQQ-binding-like beta-propeller repeat protein [bacterium]HQI48887.1 PQQ-binding-like beta-propeller repeat protein [bacterium]HQJ66142.1 PQQ-binding-like beta-propeller repeat protein [bacterium]
MIKYIAAALILLFLAAGGPAQTFQFALITDPHVGGATGAEDLALTVADINQQAGICFVILAGDVSEFGSDAELTLAKKILGRLNKPLYLVPGNHDSKWSESGCTSFACILGGECFAFVINGFCFIGTASGPNMRMAPGLVPREHLAFLDSALTAAGDRPVLFVNHYPLNDELANHAAVIRRLKQSNIQLSLLGHGHTNRLFDFSGIPGVMGRANLRTGDQPAGYTLITADSLQLLFAERTPGGATGPPWARVPVFHRRFEPDTLGAAGEAYPVNQVYRNAQERWHFIDNSDIGSGIVCAGDRAVYANARGEIVCIDPGDGSVRWRLATRGKCWATPAISGRTVVCASTDSAIYALDLKSGRVKWRMHTGKAIVASPLVWAGRIYIGSSEGILRCIDLAAGRLIWQYDGIDGFVETRPLWYQQRLYFGSWGNTFYALEASSGRLAWKRQKYVNRMLSPAAVQPVAAHGRIFIVAPDRRMTALDAMTGAEIWDSGAYSCRESIGISADGELVYIKTMQEGDLCAFPSRALTQQLAWRAVTGAGYEIAPTPIVEQDGMVLMPTTSGRVYAIDNKTGKVAWVHQLSEALITGICPAGKRRIVVTALDGTVAAIVWRRP